MQYIGLYPFIHAQYMCFCFLGLLDMPVSRGSDGELLSESIGKGIEHEGEAITLIELVVELHPMQPQRM